MCGTKVLRTLVALLATLLIGFGYAAQAVAQSAAQPADQETRMRQLQERIDALAKELKAMKEEQTKTAQTVTATAKTVSTADKTLSNFMKGFFGTLDISIDDTTKGMNSLVAFPWNYATGAPGSPYVITGGPKAPPFGRVGWIPAMSSNGSNVGYRGTHPIGKSGVDFIYQVSTSINMAAAPGLQNTWTKSSNTVQGAIGLGDTFLGFQGKSWGKLKFGEMLAPYRTSTDRLNPFAGQLGDYGVVMGNTGGDNRVEFGTRMDHLIMYNSPTWSGFSFDAAFAPGQNPDQNSNLTPLGSADCTGANNPGSGNLFLSCDDGGFQDAFSVDVKYEMGGLYLTGAYELHRKVNRSSDGVGANQPFYGYVYGLGLASQTPSANGCPTTPTNALSLQLLDWSDFIGFCNEFPNSAVAGSPEYNVGVDVADEWAMKFGGQYHFDFGLTVSYFWEEMRRNVPQIMQFQNERQRTGDWLALDYVFNGGADRIAIGWAHAGASVGDPGGQHNFNPSLLGNNESNMYTLAYWHKIDKQLTFYADIADTANDFNAHYDIGAGTHGIKTDCHDATHALFIDYSSAGPTTWGGCHPIGVSTGINFKF
jgi:predicted porin